MSELKPVWQDPSSHAAKEVYLSGSILREWIHTLKERVDTDGYKKTWDMRRPPVYSLVSTPTSDKDVTAPSYLKSWVERRLNEGQSMGRDSGLFRSPGSRSLWDVVSSDFMEYAERNFPGGKVS